jgi:hypothetical protein
VPLPGSKQIVFISGWTDILGIFSRESLPTTSSAWRPVHLLSGIAVQQACHAIFMNSSEGPAMRDSIREECRDQL